MLQRAVAQKLTQAAEWVATVASDGKLPGELLLVPLQRVDGISDDAGAIAGAGPVIADGALLNSCDSLQTEGGRPGGGCAD